MSREEHLCWAKERALQYVEAGDLGNAIASMLSDLTKHEELGSHPGIRLGTLQLVGGHLKTKEQVRHWIEGFQ